MDYRLNSKETNLLVKETLNSKSINLELANNIENIEELRELIKIGAAATYKQEYERRRIKFGVPCEIDEFPKHIYLYTALFWWVAYIKMNFSKYTFFVSIFMIKFIWNLKRSNACKIQEGYKDYLNLQNSLRNIVEMKKKLMTRDEILNAFRLN